MRIAIVDDEVYWRRCVEKSLREYAWKETIEIETFVCGEDICNKKGYDVVFMDIEMRDMDGFDAAHKYRENNEESIIIFLTTHTELSRKGYRVSAFRYIDKKEIGKELKEALLAIEELRSRNYLLHFHVVGSGEIRLRVKDILYIETELRNVKIHTKDKQYVSNRKIDDLEEELSQWGFFRCHKSYLVNVENIKDVKKGYVYFDGVKEALVGEKKYVGLKKLYMEYQYNHAYV